MLIKQPNKWSCTVASLAMLLNIPLEQIIKELGHDGSAFDSPTERRGFCIDELQDICFTHGKALAYIGASPGQAGYPILSDLACHKRLRYYLKLGDGLLGGQFSLDQWHMVAWINQKIYDPMEPAIKDLDCGFTIDQFFLLLPGII